MADDDVAGVSDWFRSDKVEYISIVLQEHAAHKVLSRLGRLGVVQFTDLNHEQTVFQRRYVREVQRCNTLERKLTYLEQQMSKWDVHAAPKPGLDKFLNRLETRQGVDRSGATRDQSNFMDILEARVDEKEAEMVELSAYNTTLSSEYNAQVELQHVLEKARNYATENMSNATSDARSAPVEGGAAAAAGDLEGAAGGYEDSLRFQFVAGVCNAEDRKRFERMVFRSTRGNCLMRFYTIDDDLKDESGELLRKDVFIIFFQSQLIQEKIKRIAEAFGARLYQIPDLADVEAIDARTSEVHNDINDRRRVLQKNNSDIKVLLSEVALSLEAWKWSVMREKSIFHTMNHFSSDVHGMLRAEGWVIAAKLERVEQLVMDAHVEMAGVDTDSANVPASVSKMPQESWPSMPPTYYKTNKFTSVFQIIVDTYGVPRYQEANPAVMTVITFPFCFGVMFGDIGHGLLLFLFGLWMVYSENKLLAYVGSNELFDIVYGGRYMLVLMGFFALYAGFIYNDFFAIGLLLWPTHWMVNEDSVGSRIGFLPNPDVPVYPLGVDPTWHRATNDLLYFNSVKMKMAVIFGVVQMSMGLVHRTQNAFFFNKRGLFHNLDFWFEALPMLVFMFSLFGYMCFLILYKWSLQWVWEDCVPVFNDANEQIGTTAPGCDRTNCCNPPALITQLINIALSIGNVPTNEQLYEGQGNVQAILLAIAVVMVPLMLVPKPYFVLKRMKQEHAAHPAEEGHHENGEHDEHADLMIGDEGVQVVAKAPGGDHDEEHSAGDIIIHQAIETIEFTLGCISNTASYLRLWALSLAHSQLASAFLENCLLNYIGTTGPMGVIITFIGYALFAVVTFAILMLMDNLEAFLHALRLHWVEFQNKFFHGDGIAFTPFSFREVLKA